MSVGNKENALHYNSSPDQYIAWRLHKACLSHAQNTWILLLGKKLLNWFMDSFIPSLALLSGTGSHFLSATLRTCGVSNLTYQKQTRSLPDQFGSATGPAVSKSPAIIVCACECLFSERFWIVSVNPPIFILFLCVNVFSHQSTKS